MNRKRITSIIIIVVLLLVIAAVIFAVQKSNTPDETADTANQETTEETKEMGYVLNELPKGSFEIQDNTITDTWGVVLKLDKLPEELKGAEAYTITIGEKTYDLVLNKYNDNVYSGQVSSVEHTQEEVGKGTVKVKN